MKRIRNTQPTGSRRHLILGLLAFFTLVSAVVALTGTLALPNAHTSPQALSGRSATVEGSIIDSWDEGGAPAGESPSSCLVPRARFHREVRLHSDADIETYGYILIEIPQVRAALEDEEPHMQDALLPCINEDSFIQVGSSANAGVLAWIHSLTGTDPQKNTVRLYRYRLPLRPGETTPPLFTEVAVPDFSAAEALTGALSVQGFLIQREHLDETAADALACNWANVERYKISRKIYDMTEMNTANDMKDIRKTMKCPLCRGRMLEGRKSWFCENWKQGCTARIWKETYGRHLTVDEVDALLTGNKIGPFDLTSRAGKKYRAALVYDKEIRKVRPVFEEQQ